MLKQILKLFTKNLASILQFELVYKLFAIFILFPLLAALLQLTMHLTGHPYLELSNLDSFFFNPLTLLFLLVAILLLTAYAMLDIATIIIFLDQSRQNQTISVLNALKTALNKLKNLFHHRNLLLPLVILILLPFLDIGLAFGINQQLDLPEFITSYILNNTPLLILTTLVFLVLTIIAIRWMYAFHFFVLEDSDFKTARKQSRALIKHYTLKDILLLLFAQLIYALFAILLLGLCALLFWLATLLFTNQADLLDILATTLLNLLLIFLTLTSTPYIYAVISVRFYRHKVQKHDKICHLTPEKTTPKTSKKLLYAAITIFILLLSGTYYFTLGPGKYSLTISDTTPGIVAHRGYSSKYPENTIPAFEAAVATGADWLELDVQETKDGQIVVAHDSNLLRTAGVDQNIYDLTYDELKSINLGNDTTPEAHVPLLSELFDYAAKTPIKLNIELKYTGHEQNLEQATIALIRQYHLENRTILASLNYSMLETSYSLAPDIPTLYIMPFAYGDVTTIAAITDFSIEASSITPELIATIHQADKKIYAWTVDDADTITQLKTLGVDGIITNDPESTKSILNE